MGGVVRLLERNPSRLSVFGFIFRFLALVIPFSCRSGSPVHRQHEDRVEIGFVTLRLYQVAADRPVGFFPARNYGVYVRAGMLRWTPALTV